MAVNAYDLRLYGSDVMADDDSVEEVGGAIDLTKRVSFVDVSGEVQLVSSDPYDAEDVEVFYRDADGAVQSETQTMDGTTPVPYALDAVRLLKAVKSYNVTGDVAVESQTATRVDIAQDGDAARIQLDAAASGVDDFYFGMVIRLNDGQIREVIAYDGTTKWASVSRPWDVVPDVYTTFRVAKGFYFEASPDEALEVRRVFYDAAAEAADGAAREYYDKVFWKNCSADDLTLGVVSKPTDPPSLVEFALETSLDGSGTNGASNNRQVAPSSGVGAFDDSAKSVVGGGTLAGGEAQGVWLKLPLAAGEGARNAAAQLALSGNS